VENVGSVSVAVTLPTAATLGVPNCMFKEVNWTTGSGTTVTVTPTTWTVNGNATLVLAIGQEAIFSKDPNSSTNWIADVFENGGIVAGSNVTLTRTAKGGLTVAASGGGGTPQTTVGLGGIWSNGYPLSIAPFTNNTAAPSTTAYAQQFQVWNPAGQVVGRTKVWTIVAGTAETLYTCIYNAAATSLLWQGSVAVNSTSAVATATATQVTLPPGVYWMFYQQSGTTAATFGAFGAGSTYGANISNSSAAREGTTANSLSGSTCPSSLGLITAAVGVNGQVMIAIEP